MYVVGVCMQTMQPDSDSAVVEGHFILKSRDSVSYEQGVSTKSQALIRLMSKQNCTIVGADVGDSYELGDWRSSLIVFTLHPSIHP